MSKPNRRSTSLLERRALAKNFRGIWRDRYGDTPPLGHILRGTYPERWVRIHSLLESKRYAENAAERRVLLERANNVAAHIFGDGNECWIVAVDFKGPRRIKKRWKNKIEFSQFGFTPVFRCEYIDDNSHIEFDEIIKLSVYVSKSTWKSNKYNNLIWLLANFEVDDIIWISLDGKRIFAPYDGGVDMILESASDVVQFKRKYADWLSAHPKGL